MVGKSLKINMRLMQTHRQRESEAESSSLLWHVIRYTVSVKHKQYYSQNTGLRESLENNYHGELRYIEQTLHYWKTGPVKLSTRRSIQTTGSVNSGF